MRVDEKLDFDQYMKDLRFNGRHDHYYDKDIKNKYALISKYYFYFGENAVDISILPDNLRDKKLFKTGQGYRKDLPQDSIDELIRFFEENCHGAGMYGYPCCPDEDAIKVEFEQNTLPHQFLSNNSQRLDVTENTPLTLIRETHAPKTKGSCK